MAVLSEVDILEMIANKTLLIKPLCLERIQPASIDLTLDKVIKIPEVPRVIELTQDNTAAYKELTIKEYYLLEPNAFILAQCLETIGIPATCSAHLHNRSSMSRLGLDVASGSFINPGYKGKLPLCIKNVGKHTIKLVPNIRIAQLELHKLQSVPMRDYSQRSDAKYLNELNILVSHIHQDEELKEFKQHLEQNNEGASLTAFLNKRIKSSSIQIVDELPEELKKKLGIL